ncbi:DUF2845 domain-containing protein [Kaarinaea lacus]
MKNQIRVNLILLMIVGAVMLFFSFNASAGTIRCGGGIIDDGDRRGISKQEVEKRCGQPYSKYGNSWIYSLPNGTVTRIRFKSNGEVSSITNERI